MTAHRRGVALLLVLATLVVVVPTMALLTTRATALHRQSRQSSVSVMLYHSLPAIQARIQAWLAEESATTVLPLEAISPSLLVESLQLDIQRESNAEATWITMHAFDLRGMLPVAVVRDTPLGQRLLSDLAGKLREESLERSLTLGLDGWSKRSVLDGGHSWYPLGENAAATEPVPGGLIAFDLSELELAPVLNMNTAPWPLVEAVARSQGITDLDDLSQSRESGVSTPIVPRAAGARTQSSIRLVSSSDAWAFRVEASSGSARRAWWFVYVQDQQGWRLHRRVPIDA
jgi:hypothetical protein